MIWRVSGVGVVRNSVPLYKTITIDPQTRILLWKITESYEQLREEVQLKDKSALRLEGMKSIPHRRGFLSVRKLLQEIGYTDFDLHYDAFGKPYFEDGTHISISHSHEFSSIIISDKIAGIDLELCRDKAAVIADKYLHEREAAALNREASDYVQKLTVLWGIKEVVFKIRNEPGISFKDHVRAEPFEMKDGQTFAYLEMDTINLPFTVYLVAHEKNILVYGFVGLTRRGGGRSKHTDVFPYAAPFLLRLQLSHLQNSHGWFQSSS
jgi:4'-phosphopantetheinyl transferase